MSHSVFIDGQAGTTGIELAERLATRTDITVLEIEHERRKDTAARAELLREADISFLCLPDDASREAVALAGDHGRLIDASTAHRTAPGWVYGLPELDAKQRERIQSARRVANPGCYPQGFILLVRPLIDAGLLQADRAYRIHALSGYSGGGRAMIERYQALKGDAVEAHGARPYALQLNHKHVPEMTAYSGVSRRPLFAPVVANYYKGMLVHIPILRHELKPGTTPANIVEVLRTRYAGERFVQVLDTAKADPTDEGFLDPTTCNGTNRIELMVFGNNDQMLLVARYDNLGKGAAGAAIQNMNVMIGAPDERGLQ